jgi:hypothetical protein
MEVAAVGRLGEMFSVEHREVLLVSIRLCTLYLYIYIFIIIYLTHLTHHSKFRCISALGG